MFKSKPECAHPLYEIYMFAEWYKPGWGVGDGVYIVPTPITDSNREMRVSELIDFSPPDRQLILQYVRGTGLGEWELFNRAGESELWEVVWDLGGPPKLSHFLWRACKGSLGAMDVLYRRRAIRPSSNCGVCGHSEKTILHAVLRP
ncbi:uncharacterized protein [Spinacia oleracea]|uniref:Reverse transcriptase zinc-binding domain-containing protein n=1 Tax=Spinacia oleracea TaxID=3562 RepID=A0ABM3RNC3_SPIOL|nr:uncharacterized protein LOC130470630 [Spinacia oleracea]